MTIDVLLLALAGLFAALAGGATILLAPGRGTPLLAGGALALLGVVHIGFARVAMDAPWGGDALWFRHTLTLALPVTTLWVLLSIVLGRRGGEALSVRWRGYLVLQAILSIAALAWSALAPDPAQPRSGTIPLDAATRGVLGLILLNIAIFTVNFEATYVSFPRRHRRSFRPALWGIFLCAVFYASLAARGILAGSASVSDLAFGTAPVAILALAMPVSFVRRRLGVARIAPDQQPVTATISYLLATGFVAATALMFWLNQAMGLSTVRGLWVLSTGGLILVVTALAVSNRARRRAERLFAPFMSEWRRPLRRAVKKRIRAIESASTIQELLRVIPENARELTDLEAITLLLSHGPTATYRVVSSTIDPAPSAIVGRRDPLAEELRRARRPIRLDGRPDDLEYVSIYIENREAIQNCRARIAAPLMGEEAMIGIVLAAGPAAAGGSDARAVALLDIAARHYARLIERTVASRTPEGEIFSNP